MTASDSTLPPPVLFRHEYPCDPDRARILSFALGLFPSAILLAGCCILALFGPSVLSPWLTVLQTTLAAGGLFIVGFGAIGWLAWTRHRQWQQTGLRVTILPGAPPVLLAEHIRAGRTVRQRRFEPRAPLRYLAGEPGSNADGTTTPGIEQLIRPQSNGCEPFYDRSTPINLFFTIPAEDYRTMTDCLNTNQPAPRADAPPPVKPDESSRDFNPRF